MAQLTSTSQKMQSMALFEARVNASDKAIFSFRDPEVRPAPRAASRALGGKEVVFSGGAGLEPRT